MYSDQIRPGTCFFWCHIRHHHKIVSDPTVRITSKDVRSQIALFMTTHTLVTSRYKHQRSHMMCPTTWVVDTRLRSQPLEWWSYNELLVTTLSALFAMNAEWNETWMATNRWDRGSLLRLLCSVLRRSLRLQFWLSCYHCESETPKKNAPKRTLQEWSSEGNGRPTRMNTNANKRLFSLFNL
jgi:hypothetical protein